MQSGDDKGPPAFKNPTVLKHPEWSILIAQIKPFAGKDFRPSIASFREILQMFGFSRLLKFQSGVSTRLPTQSRRTTMMSWAIKPCDVIKIETVQSKKCQLVGLVAIAFRPRHQRMNILSITCVMDQVLRLQDA